MLCGVVSLSDIFLEAHTHQNHWGVSTYWEDAMPLMWAHEDRSKLKSWKQPQFSKLCLKKKTEAQKVKKVGLPKVLGEVLTATWYHCLKWGHLPIFPSILVVLVLFSPCHLVIVTVGAAFAPQIDLNALLWICWLVGLHLLLLARNAFGCILRDLRHFEDTMFHYVWNCGNFGNVLGPIRCMPCLSCASVFEPLKSCEQFELLEQSRHLLQRCQQVQTEIEIDRKLCIKRLQNFRILVV